MIKNFEEYIQLCRNGHIDRYELNENLTQDEQNYLKNEIENWGQSQLEEGYSILEEYYNMKVPESLLKEICKQDFAMAYEILTKGVGDTCQRTVLANKVLRKMNMQDWPTYGDGKKVFEIFIQELKETTPKYGITFVK